MTDPDPPPDYQHPDETSRCICGPSQSDPEDIDVRPDCPQHEDLSAAEARAADTWAMWAHGDDYDLEAW